jgi:hypothetical protein
MSMPLQLALAAAMGLVSVDLFARAWKGFLGAVAAVVLNRKGWIGRRAMLMRLHGHLALSLLCMLALLASFRVYLDSFDLGGSTAEQMVYLLACVARMAVFFKNLSSDLDALFGTEE